MFSGSPDALFSAGEMLQLLLVLRRYFRFFPHGLRRVPATGAGTCICAVVLHCSEDVRLSASMHICI